MRLIPVKQALSMMENASTAKSEFRKLTFLTAKKDRSLCLKHSESSVILCEQGYRDESTAFSVGTDSEATRECKHAVKQAFKREFPRSHKVYVSAAK
ncbi:hypothetical protein OZX62_08075 [Bifidobacterium sp. ESL0690]|uniref:hypothetical protein n=1 Tax=Bifidobacterium sp. ESL0690 TaxID=2983214 RepID=UPI0023F6C15A|nr:hypothetical protein [Bifidobacterium sp. ESL0690]WEV46386.1 hypothetical protein OZX62_08075 [Bifidobacterium sp. ESL0690]